MENATTGAMTRDRLWTSQLSLSWAAHAVPLSACTLLRPDGKMSIACLLLRSDPCVPARRNKKKKKKETNTCHPPCSSHESGRTMCLTDSVSSESAQRLPNEVAAEKQAQESETEGKQKPTRLHCITHPTTVVPHPGRPSEGGQGIVIQHVQMSRASKMRAKKKIHRACTSTLHARNTQHDPVCPLRVGP
ncbi:hypothetical protein IWX49DRAFT_581414 [Phyllosticta citricarpa]|uniref:Uncharacterized protein n=1 Tax=Phyllosticta citricarpa TaxID=55181 RepID=A0ABR1L977_9PEZI